MFLTQSQRIATAFLMTVWYGLPVVIIAVVWFGWPAILLLLFWTSLLVYIAVLAIVHVRWPHRAGRTGCCSIRTIGLSRGGHVAANEMRPTARILAYHHGPALVALAESFLPHFPELARIDFELDLLPSFSRFLGLTDHGLPVPRVRLRPARPTNPTLTSTIAHEFTHLLQLPLRLVPQGERSCDLYALARAGERFLSPPGYVRVPRVARAAWTAWSDVAADLAKVALERRTAGERRYIAWWEAKMRAQCRGRESNPLETDLQSVTLAALSPRRDVAHPVEGN